MKKVHIIIFSLILILHCSKSYSITKQSALAGKWYPSDKTQLLQLISANNKPSKHITHTPLIVVPHAGYMYCADVAVKAYAFISSYKPDSIIIIGPSHYEYFTGFALPVYDSIITPLGKVHVDQKTIQKLGNHPLFSFNNNAFEPEHSVEIQLPFIQHYFPNVPIIPILAGNVTPMQAKEAAQQLQQAIAHYKKPLFILSSDFTHHGPRFSYAPYKHYPPNKRIEYITRDDMKAIEAILSYNPSQFYSYCESTHITICGRNAILLGLFLFKSVHLKELIYYTTSAQTTGDYDNTVSYASIVVTGTLETFPQTTITQSLQLSKADKKFLLTLARQSIESLLYKKTLLNYEGSIPQICTQKAGAFVTLTINNNLRGCIGYIEPIKPLYQTVIECAANAAFNDPRFEPLTTNEYKNIAIEISVLSPLQKIASLDELKTGIHGLLVVKGNRRGVLLPQVATQYNMTREEFFQHTCQKASIHPFEYNNLSMYIFNVEVFDEHTLSQN